MWWMASPCFIPMVHVWRHEYIRFLLEGRPPYQSSGPTWSTAQINICNAYRYILWSMSSSCPPSVPSAKQRTSACVLCLKPCCSCLLEAGFYFVLSLVLCSNFSPPSVQLVLGTDSDDADMSCYLMLLNSQCLWHSNKILHDRTGKQNTNLLIFMWY